MIYVYSYLMQIMPGVLGIGALFYARGLHHQVDELRRAIEELHRAIEKPVADAPPPSDGQAGWEELRPEPLPQARASYKKS